MVFIINSAFSGGKLAYNGMVNILSAAYRAFVTDACLNSLRKQAWSQVRG